VEQVVGVCEEELKVAQRWNGPGVLNLMQTIPLYEVELLLFIITPPRYIGDGVLFSIDFFIYIFVSKITRKRLDRFA